MKKSYLIISGIIFFLLIGAAIDTYGAAKRPPRPYKVIKVAVSRGKPEVKLTLKGNYEIYDLGTDMKIASGHRLKNAVVSASGSGLKINDEEFKTYGIKILTEKDAAIYVDRRRFRGHIDIIRNKNLKLLVINHIDIEDYLFGVLQYEVSFWWPYEALKAQAVAARTYALYQAQINEDKDYHLTNDTFSQMYGGAGKERYRTKKAVIATQSQVLTYNGEVFPAYYHATCGGRTEDSNELWNISLPPLEGVTCGFCRRSPHYYWESELELTDIEAKLRKKGYNVSEITDITVSKSNEQNRVSELEILHKKGSLKINANKFRLIAGSRYVRSTLFTVEVKDNKVFFQGYGWGHSVGLCQWGAYFMAKKGYSAEEILSHYYPSAKIEDFFTSGHAEIE